MDRWLDYKKTAWTPSVQLCSFIAQSVFGSYSPILMMDSVHEYTSDESPELHQLTQKQQVQNVQNYLLIYKYYMVGTNTDVPSLSIKGGFKKCLLP